MVKGLHEDGYDGLCVKTKKVILLDAELRGRDLWETFYHEVAHGLMYESGLGEFVDVQAEEMFAQAFASVLIALNKKNLKIPA